MRVEIELEQLLAVLDGASENALDLCNMYFNKDDAKHELYSQELDMLNELIDKIKKDKRI